MRWILCPNGTFASEPFVIGVLKGEGVGPEIVDVSLHVLNAVSDAFGRQFYVREGGPIGLTSLRTAGHVLSHGVKAFCRSIFDSAGAILAGPGGGRFVYDLRREFDLFVKLNPILSFSELEEACPIKLRSKSPVDIMVVRENRAGLYQGRSRSRHGEGEGRCVVHRFAYAEQDVLSLLMAAAQLASMRRGHVTVVAKEGGLPEMTSLWFDSAKKAAEACGVKLRTMDVDFAAYQMIAHPEEFDVMAVPNCFGDILADLGGVFMGSRGITFGASYSPTGCGVYQTNHGAAHDLAKKNKANPAGQLLSLAMLLRESFGLCEEATAIVNAVRQSWLEGWRTPDIMSKGCRLLGTAEMGDVVAENIVNSAGRKERFGESVAPAC
jgi:3-isopropylmalate dehydrogenase